MTDIPSSADVLIIGGGAAGTGIARDLAMRGADVVLIESRDFCAGASGSNHGMLHSGARYAFSDRESAAECAAENKILKNTASFCIQDTGGYFASVPEDDPEFADNFRENCRRAGIYTEEVSVKEALRNEPLLSPDITRVFEVNDAAVDPFQLVMANAEAARKYGACIMNYSHAESMSCRDGIIESVTVARAGKKYQIRPQIVINAAGAWASKTAAMAGQHLEIGIDKGTMVVIDGRITSRLINRLRKPSDADILVPHHSATIIGTTSSPGDLCSTAPTSEEADLLLREAAKIITGIHSFRAVRAYSGIRPLAGGTGRNVSRNFSITQHENSNMISVAGGKLTTYRLIAEKAADAAAAVLNISARCRTASEILPDVNIRRTGNEACTCEFVSLADLQSAASSPDVSCAADIMRRTRAGMGFCQAGMCAFSIAACLDGSVMQHLQEFLDERWKGTEPVLYDQQLRQEVFKAHLYGVYGIDHTGGK